MGWMGWKRCGGAWNKCIRENLEYGWVLQRIRPRLGFWEAVPFLDRISCVSDGSTFLLSGVFRHHPLCTIERMLRLSNPWPSGLPK